MNKKGFIFSGILIVILVLALVFVVYKTNKFKNNTCLIDIAKDYCEEKGYFYLDTSWDFKPVFYCSTNEREVANKRFLFLEEEIKECK